MRRSHIDPAVIGRELIKWWRAHGRRYPWRETRDPYKIIVAEIMLQRTKADQVLPVYRDFLEKFPTIHHLVRAAPEEIEEFFKRLGLRWRADKIRKMADFVVREYNGRFPRSKEMLMKIPGVGDYISSALLSFAYGLPYVVVDSNVCRIIQRVFGIKARGEARRDKRFHELAREMLPENEDSRLLNFALIDFAALVCKPRRPLCSSCPIRNLCSYYSGSSSMNGKG